MRLLNLLHIALVLFVCALSLANAPMAQQAAPEPPAKVIIDKRKLLVQPRNADGSIMMPSFAEDPVLWMRTKQQAFYSRMSAAMHQMRGASTGTAAWTLVMVSFLYGMFHAAGPGHGKAVVTGWVLATENELKRGVLIAGMSALIQALTAIAVVSLLLMLVQGASAMARSAANVLETTSYAMIVLMGLYLAWTGMRQLRRTTAHSAATGPFELVSRPQGSGHAHLHHHAPGEACDCGHAHMPAAQDVAGAWNWRRALALAFAVGIRPCSGAILVLVFSYSIGIYWAGIASTLAMAVGVFLTISAIAALAVFGKKVALRYMRADHPAVAWTVRTGKIAVGLAIAGLGALLLLGSSGTSGMT